MLRLQRHDARLAHELVDVEAGRVERRGDERYVGATVVQAAGKLGRPDEAEVEGLGARLVLVGRRQRREQAGITVGLERDHEPRSALPGALASRRSVAPAGVQPATPRAFERSNRGTPSRRSRRLTVRETAGWATPSRLAGAAEAELPRDGDELLEPARLECIHTCEA